MKIDFVKVRSKVLLAVALLVLLISTTSMAVVVRVDTVIGTFDINMREDVAPATVANFLNYVRDRDYDNMFFHRAPPGFVVQTGGFVFTDEIFLRVPTDPPVINEFNLSNIRATVAMAKLGGDPNSATSQWFINLTDNRGAPPNGLDFQNGGFTAFGEITESDMAIADAINGVENAIPGVDVTVFDASQTSPMSETSFAGAFAELPALDFDPDLSIPFDPNSNLVLVNSVREVGSDLVADPTSLDFGLVVLGSSSQQTITITNKGLEDLVLQVGSAGTGDPGFSVSGNACTGATATDNSCAITFEFAPQSAGSLSAGFTITSNDTDMPGITIQMTGEGIVAPEPRITLSPADTLTISDVAVGNTGTADVTVTNTGSAVLTIDTVVIGGTSAGLFSQTNDCETLAIDGTCTVTVTFTPVASSSATADLVIASNDPTQPTAILSLSGDGVAPPGPDVELETPADFGDVPVNGFKSAESIELKNVGEAVLEIGSIAIGGQDISEFVISHNCTAGELAPGLGCPIIVHFRPTSEGAKSATLIVDTNDPDTPSIAVPLTGVGAGFVEPTPGILTINPAVDFGQQTVGIPAVREFKVTNFLGAALLVVDSIEFRGFDVFDFSQTNDCSELAPRTGICTITITFVTETSEIKSAFLVINSNDPLQPELTVSVNAEAEGAEEADISLQATVDFGEVAVGSTDTEQLSLSNQGRQDLEITSIRLSGADADSYTIGNNCSKSISSGGSCTLTVTFQPTGLGVKNATITVLSNDPDEGTKVTGLSGIGANDSDGVSDEIEDGHPNKNSDGRGDGNNDGIADALQSNVASLLNIHGEYVTLVSPEDTQLLDVQAIENPLPEQTPIGIGTEVTFGQGFFAFTVADVTGPITVTFIFAPGTTLSNFFKIERTADNPTPHWYPFEYDGRLGAEFNGNEMILHLEDGLMGDADLDENGTIIDPGGPALIVPLDLSTSSGSGGCSVAKGVVPIQAAAGWWLVFGLIGWLGAVRRVSSTLTP